MRHEILPRPTPIALYINSLSVLYELAQQLAPGWNYPGVSIRQRGSTSARPRGCWRWPYVGNAENAVFSKTFCNFFPGLIFYGKQLHHTGRKKHQIGLDSAQFGA
jgi:hypothetical protein